LRFAFVFPKQIIYTKEKENEGAMGQNAMKVITAEDLYRFQVIVDMQLSPDGDFVVYAVQTVDKTSEKKFTHLWLVNSRNGQARQLTFGKQKDIHPRWSPDGMTIAFLSNRQDPEQFQLYLLPLDGGEARAISNLAGEFEYFEWSPDGKKIVLQFRKTDVEILERMKDEKKAALGAVYRQFTRTFYQLDNYGFLPKDRWHIWLLDVQKGNATQLTDHPIYDDLEPHWSPDSKSIAYFSNRSPDPDMNIDNIDIFLYNLRQGKEEKIKTQPGNKSLLSFSPDGQYIAYLGLDGLNADWKNHNLWVVNLQNQEDWKNLTRQYDIELNGSTINDIGAAKIMPPVWSKDMQKLYFQVAYHGNTQLKCIDLDGRYLKDVIAGQGVVSTYTFNSPQNKLAYLFGKMNDPCQIYILEMENSGNPRQLTEVNPWLQDINLGSVEEVWFEGAEQNRLQGWIIKPPNFSSETKYPSILEIHGGPLVQYGNFFMHEFYFLAANGYVVYLCNPRGGQGYGEEHAKAIQGQWGTADYDDLMIWANMVEKLPYIDSKRMAVTGGSYGGYMTNWIIGHTHRFRAAVTQRSVSNLVSIWGSSDFNWEFQRTFDNNAPFESIENLWECSPMKHIGFATTPTLVLHNEKDLRCPFEQGQQIFTALKYLQVDTELIQFPDEPHGLSRTGRTDRRIMRLKHMLRWFDKYLKNG
jgi:dipeptidyl aminopeptidase/acylaminoacyl peptidase